MLSVAILTKNEEKNIVDCLETVAWADEIIIVDDNSEDRTIEVIRAFNNKKIKIFQHSLGNDFSAQRNYALAKSTKNWVLFIDADERITPELKEEINLIIVNRKDNVIGYFIKRVDIIWNKLLRHGETDNILLLRLAKRGSGAWVGQVHETWQVDGKIGELEGKILHYPHQNVDTFLREINFYSTIKAKELYGKRIKITWFDIVAYPIGKFIKNYFIKFGFLDSTEGLVFAIMMSFHSFLVRGKLWILWQRK